MTQVPTRSLRRDPSFVDRRPRLTVPERPAPASLRHHGTGPLSWRYRTTSRLAVLRRRGWNAACCFQTGGESSHIAASTNFPAADGREGRSVQDAHFSAW